MDSVSRVELDGNTFGSVPVRELLSADGAHAVHANFKVGDNGCTALASHWHCPCIVEHPSFQNTTCASVHRNAQHLDW